MTDGIVRSLNQSHHPSIVELRRTSSRLVTLVVWLAQFAAVARIHFAISNRSHYIFGDRCRIRARVDKTSVLNRRKRRNIAFVQPCYQTVADPNTVVTRRVLAHGCKRKRRARSEMRQIDDNSGLAAFPLGRSCN